MSVRFKERFRALVMIGAVLGAASASIACGDDDSGGSSGASSSGSTTSSSGSTGTPTPPPPQPPPPPPPPPPAPPPAPQAATPTFTPTAPATFTSSVPGGVTIASTTPNATIFYTTDGTNPTTSSVVYTSAISVTSTTTIRAMAAAPGFSNSAVGSATYTINPPAPGQLSDVTITPQSGQYNNPVSVGLSVPVAEAPATICYTLDGSAPTCDAATATCTGTAATYSAGAPLQVDAPVGGGTTTVRAIACKVGQITSANIQQSALSFKVADPTATLPTAPAEVAPGTNITLATATLGTGTNVHYRTDGNNPNCIAAVGGAEQACGGSACLVPIAQNTTIKAIGCKPNYADSAMMTFNYTVRVDQPTLDDDTYDNDHPVVVGPNATVVVAPDWHCFATGTTQPACGTAVDTCTTGSDTAPTITVTNTTVNVQACKVGFVPSIVTSGIYNLQVGTVTITGDSGGTYSPVGTGPIDASNYWANGAPTAFTLDTSTNNSGNNVSIRYTIDGTSPTCTTGTQVAKGATVLPNPTVAFTTIKAIGCKTSYLDSIEHSLKYADPDLIVTLTPLPALQTFDNNVEVILTAVPAAGVGANDTHICYNVGQNPGVPAPDCDPATAASCVNSTLYDPANPFTVNTTGFQVRAIACKTGVPQKSDPTSGVFNFKMGAPTVSDAAAPAVGGQVGPNVAYNSNFYFRTSSEPSVGNGVTLNYRYTTDGTDPLCGAPGAGLMTTTQVTFAPPTNAAVTYKVRACDTGNNFAPSDITTVVYTGVLAQPTFTPNGATLNNDSSTTVASVSAEYLCVSTDGSTPSCVGGGGCAGGGNTTSHPGANWVQPIAVDQTIVRAVACRNTGFLESPLGASNIFAVSVADPAVEPQSGLKTAPVTVTINNGATLDAKVCFSEAGPITFASNCADPVGSTCQPLATGGAAMTNGMLALANRATSFSLNVRSCKVGYAPSTNVVRSYTFAPYTRTIALDGNDDWSLTDNNLFTENVDNGYLAWDGTYIYFGFRGASLTNTTARYFNIYLRSPTGPYTITRDNRLGANTFGELAVNNWGMMPQPTGGVNYHFFYRTDRNEAPGSSRWDGANWVDAAATAPWECASGGTLGQSNALVECRVSRTAVGLPAPGTANLIFSGHITDSSSSSHNQFPYAGHAAYTGTGHGFWSGDMATNIPSDATRVFQGIETQLP